MQIVWKNWKKKIFEKLNDQRTLLQLITLVDMSKITNEKKYNLLLLLHLLYFSSNAFKYFFSCRSLSMLICLFLKFFKNDRTWNENKLKSLQTSKRTNIRRRHCIRLAIFFPKYTQKSSDPVKWNEEKKQHRINSTQFEWKLQQLKKRRRKKNT